MLDRINNVVDRDTGELNAEEDHSGEHRLASKEHLDVRAGGVLASTTIRLRAQVLTRCVTTVSGADIWPVRVHPSHNSEPGRNVHSMIGTMRSQSRRSQLSHRAERRILTRYKTMLILNSKL